MRVHARGPRAEEPTKQIYLRQTCKSIAGQVLRRVGHQVDGVGRRAAVPGPGVATVPFDHSHRGSASSGAVAPADAARDPGAEEGNTRSAAKGGVVLKSPSERGSTKIH